MVQFVKIIESHCKFISFLNTSAYHAYTRYINKLKIKHAGFVKHALQVA